MTNELGNCGFCFESFDGKRGTSATQRVWSKDFSQYIPVCEKHGLEIQAAASADLNVFQQTGSNRQG